MITATNTTLDVNVQVLGFVQWIFFGLITVLARQELHLYFFGGYSGCNIWAGLIVSGVSEFSPRLSFGYRLGHQTFLNLVRTHNFFLLVVLVPAIFRNDPVVADLFGLCRRQRSLLQVVFDLVGPAGFD